MKKHYKSLLLILFFFIASFQSFLIYNGESSNEKIVKIPELFPSADPSKEPFFVGVMSNPIDLDPHNAWDRQSYNVIEQVCEGLYTYDLDDPNLAIIPNLASSDGTWSLDGLEYTVSLITNATFHDGTQFNATAAQWSFNRLQYFMNHTGQLPISTSVSLFHTMYEFEDGTPIINRTEIVNDFTIKFVLNRPFVALPSLLCIPGSYILSPTSTSATDYLDTTTDDLVGTGPFVYDGYIPDINISFHSYEDYWRGKADFDEMYFLIIDDPTARHDALLDGTVDFIANLWTDYLDSFNANPNITVLDYGKTRATTFYLCMNNKQINHSFRQAISYAINYSYIIDDIYEGNVVRAKSPIPQGILYSNWTNNYATFNIQQARQVMQSMGDGYTGGTPWDTTFPGTDEALWSSASFATFNYSYYTGNRFQSDLYVLLQNNLDLIGIDVLDGGTDWAYFIYRAYGFIPGGYDQLQLFWIGWGADYNDPVNFINTFFSNTSISNAAQVNDPYLQNLIDQGYEETDPILRKQIYDEIQRFLVENLMPWAWGICPKLFDAHHIDLSGFQQNAMEKLDFYQCQWNRIVYETQLSEPDDITYTEGSTGNILNWTITADKVLNPMYYVYNSSGLVQSDTWSSGVPVIVNVDGLSFGTYTYWIEVHNGNVILSDYIEVFVFKKRSPITFLVGTSTGLLDLDPHNTWDTWSYNVIDQVCEGLYEYDLDDPNSAIIPNLASSDGTWSLDGLEYTISLITNGTFHDGTQFNATAVQWSFNRLQYFMNHTGQLPISTSISIFHSMYEFEDGTPIINNVQIINEFTIKFVLNRPFAALPSLLCNPGSYILSPASTPATNYLDKTTDDLVGTGPFVYDGYIPEKEVYFHAYDDYWKGKADIDEMYFVIYEDYSALRDALLDGTIHFIINPSYNDIDTFNANPTLTVLDTGTTKGLIYYLCMNNKQINQTFRQAISYAINYSYIIDDMMEGNVVRAGSPIPQGLLYSNWTNDYATFNITKAREIMQSMGFGEGWDTAFPGTDEALWSSASFAAFKYTYNVDNQFRVDFYSLLYNCLDLIGIDVIDDGVDWWTFFERILGISPGGYDDLQLFWIGWGADYNDPVNFINTFFSNISFSNAAQVNDPYLQNLIDQGYEETDPILRKLIYDEIQRYLVEDLMPWAWGICPKLYNAYHIDLSGYKQNAMQKVYFYPCQWNRQYPGSFNLYTDADPIDDDGNFDLNWDEAEDATNYTVYEHSSYITVINGGLTPLLVETNDLTLSRSGYSDGTYFFIITANNEYGYTESNCIEVYVRFPQPPGPFNLFTDADPIDDDGIFNLNWDEAEDATNYTVYEHSSYITVINGSLTPLLVETTDRSLSLSEYTSGTYYFIVVAYNDYGQTMSNCIKVVVQIPQPSPPIPGYSIYILICAISIASIILVKKLNLKMPKELKL